MRWLPWVPRSSASRPHARTPPGHCNRVHRRNLPDRVRPARATRLDGSGHREHSGIVVAARSDVRAADDLPRQAGSAVLPPGSRGRGGAADSLTGRQDVHVHAQARLPFSDGKPVDARAFARAINRTLAPDLKSLGTRYMQDIVGARAVQAGTATTASGVVARGYRLVDPPRATAGRLPRAHEHAVLLRRPARTSRPIPRDAARFAGSGPYYVSEYRPGQRVTLMRNRYYRGPRRTMSTGSAST